MPWRERRYAPPGWAKTRQRVIARAGGRCEHTENGKRCIAAGRDVDHIAGRDNHQLDNLQLLCPPHHAEKTQREAQAARPTTRRPPEQHPGLTEGWGTISHRPTHGG